MALLAFWCVISLIVCVVSWAVLSGYADYNDRDGTKRLKAKKVAYISSAAFLALGSLIFLIASF